MLTRTVEKSIEHYLKKKQRKILFVWGPRRSGKTTLLQKLSKQYKIPIFDFTTLSDRELFPPRREILQAIATSHPIVLIDEIQYYPEATIALKILHDEFQMPIIATGSSELRRKSAQFDSLAGRYQEIYCLPVSLEEALANLNQPKYRLPGQLKQIQDYFQIFGSYPEVYTQSQLNENEKIDLLEKIVDAYVLKDIINIYDLKSAKLAKDILTKVALQLGSEVSIREIAASLQANAVTVSNYLEIFIKNYILLPLPPFKTNLRRAVSENRKLYFWDLGIRNALIKDFRPVGLRPDKGGVFENLVTLEFLKLVKNHSLKLNLYFYREYGGKEIDLVVEDYQKHYWIFEIKSQLQALKSIFPYPHKKAVITPDNFFNLTQDFFANNISCSSQKS